MTVLPVGTEDLLRPHDPYQSPLTLGAVVDPAISALRSICGSSVEVDARIVTCDERCLEPAERAVIGAAVPGRLREFATVRCCARTAMTRIGCRPSAILPRNDGPVWARRAPRWPVGVVGSMTHCHGFSGAAVARNSHITTLGIDAEVNAPLPPAVRESILLPDEARAVDALALASPRIAWDRLVFSAKEAVYKAWYPITGGWLDFHDCAVRINEDQNRFEASIRATDPTGALNNLLMGTWHGDADRILTAMVVSAC